MWALGGPAKLTLGTPLGTHVPLRGPAVLSKRQFLLGTKQPYGVQPQPHSISREGGQVPE